ncbi:CAAX prenyl protease 1 homolog isoform X1 [Homarus americanus]|uniref:CAAX prenyl protease 1 homolog isoform X1 n=1 Tax=Homarus americanus TaxID=6706 RepID=UPI001C483D74|nr:CAAX prenyl protease 1 homolog isoform X1 [Homarus americanus]
MISLAIPDFGTWEGKIFVGILGFSWATYMWEEYLAYRQRRVYREKVEPPEELKGIMERVTYDKARAYGLDKSNFSLIEGAFNQVLSTGIMVCGGFPALWTASGRLAQWFGFAPDSEIPQTVTFVCLGSLINTFISLPWSTYFTFKVEQKHGFNKQTPGFFLKDKLKKFIVSQMISAPVVSGLVYIIRVGGDYFFLYLWGFTMIVVMFFMTVYPDYIAPLFDKYEPLPEGDLKTKIEELAAQIEFPLTKLYVVEGSKRSAHSNAYFYGFFKNKRIVLYDTLLEEYTPLNENEETKESVKEDKNGKKTGCNTSEVLAVLGHELGHWKLNHVLKFIIISQVNLFLVFSVFGSLYKYSPLYRTFGFYQNQPAFIGLIIVMQFVFAPYNEILQFLLTMFSRYNEFQADDFATKLGHARNLKSALIKLNEDNLGFPVYDPLYSAWHHSHPPILERIRALEEKKKED